ncbi:reverse transcriptase [Phytophthora megakarya]|uniref:Reverse transcriptase n=1 Tax=Phytophthora megakarya TaxID=4795 RepID=A0A225VNP3_9STRA|nr:reverse transcriptase [Phytophthora megakarya]
MHHDSNGDDQQGAKSARKRVRFADETSAQSVDDIPLRGRSNDTPSGTSNIENQKERRVTGSTPASPSADNVDPLEIQKERRRMIATADRFVLSEDNVLYHLRTRFLRGDHLLEEPTLRLVVLTTVIQEVLQNCHDSLESDHPGIARTFYQAKVDYYWIGLYADVVRHWAFTGSVIGKAMANTTALWVAQVFEECVYQRFGAQSLIRHDRDPRFMSESMSSATLSYRPQANGQQELSVKTVMQSVRVYGEDPLQQDWDDIVVKLINNWIDATRKETPFYLIP